MSTNRIKTDAVDDQGDIVYYTISEWKERFGEPGSGADINGRINGYLPTEPDYCEDAPEAPAIASNVTPIRPSRKQQATIQRIAKTIQAAPRHTPTEESIQQLRDERSRLLLKRIYQTLSNAEPSAIDQTMNEIRSLELRILDDETALLKAA